MTRNRPLPARAVPRRPIVCRCSSASTSFMLAALRVLHVDPFPRTGSNRLDRGTTFLGPSTARGQRGLFHQPTKQPDQEDEEAAARGVICVPTMNSNGIHTPEATFVT